MTVSRRNAVLRCQEKEHECTGHHFRESDSLKQMSLEVEGLKNQIGNEKSTGALERQKAHGTNTKNTQRAQYQHIEFAELVDEPQIARHSASRLKRKQKGRDASTEHAPESPNRSASTMQVCAEQALLNG